jgi:zinc protease
LAPRAVAQQPAAPRQTVLDRTKEPKPDPTPRLRVPAWTEMGLANGAQLVVVERHALPLVSFTMTFVGGSYQLVSPEKTGLGSFVATMLKEGTKTKSGDELSNAMQLLGSTVNVNVGGESGSIGFTAMKDKFEGMLAILGDILVNPSFPADALERFRGQRLVQLQQDRDRTDYLASIAFPTVVYSVAHPYGRTISETSIKAITRDDLINFHRQYFQPGRAIITVVGDV